MRRQWNRLRNLRFDGEDDYVVGRDLGCEFPREFAEVLVGPEVADRSGQVIRIAEVGPRNGDLGFAGSAIQEQDSAAAVFHGLGPNFKVAFLPYPAGLASQLILVDG